MSMCAISFKNKLLIYICAHTNLEHKTKPENVLGWERSSKWERQQKILG